MLSIKNNAITLTQGNSATIQISIMNEETGAPYILTNADYVLFTVKRTYNGAIRLQKRLTVLDYDEGGTLCCNLSADDTLSLVVDTYKYDCVLVSNDQVVTTFISSTLTITGACGTINGGENNGN